MASGPTNKLQNWLANLGRQRREVGIGLLILWVTFGVAGNYLGYKYYQGSSPNLSWGEVTALFFVCGGGFWGAIWCLTNFSASTNDSDHGRLTVAIVGSFVGLGLLALSALRTYKDWKDHISPGLEVWQGKEGWHVWVCLLSAVGGLAVLFLTITLIRSEEQSGRYARVIIYGYIAVQSCLMLLGVLVFINVIAYFLFPKPADWTAGGIFTLNEQSEKILKSLKQPVKIYYLTASHDDDSDIELLLNNCQTVTDKIQTEAVLRDRNIRRMGELREKYQLPLDSSGLLVTTENSEGKSDYQFIRTRDMFEPGKDPEHPLFKGEAALMTAIDFLAEGKSKTMVYFTQGSGEMDLFGLSRGMRRDQLSGSALAERLRKSNYEVKGLILDPLAPIDAGPQMVKSATVPDDAGVVVVAGPTQRLSEATVSALRTYMNTPNSKKKKGRLVVLSGAIPDPDAKGKILTTGLEGLLAEYSVDLTRSRILSAVNSNPLTVGVVGNPTIRNPIAEALNQLIAMGDARVVRSVNAAAPRGGPTFQAEEFLAVPPAFKIWTSEDINETGSELFERNNDEAIEKINKRLSRTYLPVGVVVTESDDKAPNPANPHVPGGEGTPRLVVVGNARFLSDDVLGSSGRQATYSYAVMSSSLAWLREKPAGIGIPAADRKSYTMNADTHVDRMIGLPVVLMVFAIFGLGIATWVVRRR